MINFCIGISVVIKNYINKFCIHSYVTSIYFILLIEILIFVGSSLIYLLYLFLLINSKKIEKRKNSFQSDNTTFKLETIKEEEDRKRALTLNCLLLNKDNSLNSRNNQIDIKKKILL